MFVVKKLLDWYEKEGRDLPWRKTQNPYFIVVSEFMLQQTQVSRVIKKYESWIKRFPNWDLLAQASRQEVLFYWSGLGYNSRAARLHTLAKVVVETGLPDSEEELQKLPGIGPYTAGAICAFAYDKPGNFVDVNVERVIKRYYFPKNKLVSRKETEQKLELLQHKHSPRHLANALMDFGSICSANPHCDICPLFSECESKGRRPDEKIIKQSTFKNSNRWWRGKILKKLTEKSSTKQEIITIDDNYKNEILIALEQLKKEGLIEGEQHIRIKDA